MRLSRLTAVPLVTAVLGVAGCASHPAAPTAALSREVESAVDRALPYDFVVRADTVAEEAGDIRCASRLLSTEPRAARHLRDVETAYLVAACAGRTEQAVAKNVPPVCLVVPVVAKVGRRTTLPTTSFEVIDTAGDRLRSDVRRAFPERDRADALRARDLAGPLWARLGQDPARCGR